MFCKEVDGVYLPAVTHWFYGGDQSTLAGNAEENVDLPAGLVDEVDQLAHAFFQSVSKFPFTSQGRLAQEVSKFEKLIALAAAHGDTHLPLPE